MAEESKESTLTIRVTSLVKAKAMRRVLQEGANSVTQHRRRTSFVTCAAVLVTLFVFDLAGRYAWSESLFDESVRAQMFKHSNGLIAHIKTEYNNIFIVKHKQFLFLTTRFRGEDHIQTVVDLEDPDDMMAPYTRIASVALVYPETIHRILMVGLGAGSMLTYIGRAMPEAQIDAVELDPGVIAVGKRYFGLKETERVRFIESDGLTYLSRHKDCYDIILLDAFRELGVPSDMRTRDFYTLVKERLAAQGVAVFNIAVGPKFYRSTLVSLREVFQTVDVYPDRSAGPEEQAIAVAVPARKPSRTYCCNAPMLCRTGFVSDILCPFCLKGGLGNLGMSELQNDHSPGRPEALSVSISSRWPATIRLAAVARAAADFGSWRGIPNCRMRRTAARSRRKVHPQIFSFAPLR